ncbi:sulfate ABC transporter substrate-binding protein [Limnothrix sp. FACHB-1083]|uniref:sulfate ABC transporter substrate-binding protein n=1 Tax=unclassified Limnothrix TaxID=2632864 RepID=UPI0016801C1A|nr:MULTISPECIES: sulfate ABC transporter substrate-binding protein [unclassified Limnothrix]MBD2161932.1 sulfate ABC transporter substrate-binding protein [Limnothrix sp. FACHB-1083]MBD2192825.1 sulfate ABC transporter substrate-binding protein [Limnothrix sp. FACHB-1088]
MRLSLLQSLQALRSQLDPLNSKAQRLGRRTALRSIALAVASGLSVLALSPTSTNAASARLGNPSPQNQPLQISQNKPVEITLVTYAVTRAAYDKIIPLFVEKWKREQGQEVVINASYGGSGSQTRAVLDGLEADVVALALAADTKRLEKGGLINPGWESEAPNNAIVTRSVIAFVTRQGNPKAVRNWPDLLKPEVSIITANPKTSGVARWNFLGLWGSVTHTGGSEEQALDYVRQVYRKVPVLPKDARESSDVFFRANQGDVLLNYENEVILAGLQGQQSLFYVVPQTNISIDTPVAVVDKIVDRRGTRAVSEAFVKFLFTPEAQREFAKVGFRPVEPGVVREFENKFPKVNKLYTVNDFGGWDAVNKKFFDEGAVFDQIYTNR